jgi:peptidoglycan/LPS O-acetylase OafA/YrhL
VHRHARFFRRSVRWSIQVLVPHRITAIATLSSTFLPARPAPVARAAEKITAPSLEPATRVHRAAEHLPALDGIRGIAILLVLHIHFSMDSFYHSYAGWLYTRFSFTGWIGVDLFFVLSGFLITGVLLDSRGGDDRKSADPHYFRNFYMRRTLRIFPLYYGSLVLLFLILPLFKRFQAPPVQYLAAHQKWLWFYGANILISLKNDWVLWSDWFVLNPFWSLAVEEHFYLVWPLVVFFLPRKWLLRVCVASLPFCLALRFLILHFSPNFLASSLLTPCRIDSLCFGGLLALAIRSPGPRAAALRRAAPYLAAAFFLPMLPIFANTNGSGANRADFWMHFAGHTLLTLSFGFLIFAAATSSPRSWLVRFLSLPFLRACGKYSYGMYVIHSVLHPWFMRFFPVDVYWQIVGHQLLAVWIHVVFSVAATFALGWLSWHLYEKHFLKLKRFFVPRPTVLMDGPAAVAVPVAVLVPTA